MKKQPEDRVKRSSSATESSFPPLALIEWSDGFSVLTSGRPIFKHSRTQPGLAIGRAETDVLSKSGFFRLRERRRRISPLRDFVIEERTPRRVTVIFGAVLRITLISDESGAVAITPAAVGNGPAGGQEYNRFRIRLPLGCDSPAWHRAAGSPQPAVPAEDRRGMNRRCRRGAGPERIYGGGEQLGRLNLAGSRLPVWISEPGVGRRFDPITIGFALKTGHIPRWYNTYYSMPSFVTSSGRYAALESTAYSILDFRRPGSCSITCWEIPSRILVGAVKLPEKGVRADALSAAVGGLSAVHGRQPRLPDWVDEGVILGIQGGSETVLRKLQRVEEGGVSVAALWCQDWEGRRKTKFGSQLRWAWEYDAGLYPDLPGLIARLRERGIRFLGYNNTFLTPGSAMYAEAVARGFILTRPDGSPYLVYVPFDPAVLIDFTNPDATAWLKQIIRKNMIDIGMSGWMADFGEMVPHDAVTASGIDGLRYHNQYPVDWAKINWELVTEAGMEDEAFFFMRAGFSGASRYTVSNWNGDQLVDWSRADGLPSAIMGSLSLGMSGVGCSHSDIGGYTTLGYKKRSAELLMRWAEYAAFTPTMRSHEGNRPENNVQIADSEEVIGHLAGMVKLFCRLGPYRARLGREYREQGIPYQRIPELHYPDEARRLGAWPYQYLFGQDLLVAPVIRPGRKRWRVLLPRDRWVHLWSGLEHQGGRTVVVDAPLGRPPVFYRAGSEFCDLFRKAGSR